MDFGLKDKSLEELETLFKYVNNKKDSKIYASSNNDSVKFSIAPVEFKKELLSRADCREEKGKSELRMASTDRPNAVVVVLGDVGRSPRMANHSLSLATQLNYNVYMVGYSDSHLHPTIQANPHIKLVAIPAPYEFQRFLPEQLSLILKLIWMFFTLFFTLMFRVPLMLDLILMQNPPGLPSMFVCWLVSCLKCTRWIVDWHNYTYRMLQHKWNISFNPSRATTQENEDSRSDAGNEPTRRRISRGEREMAAREKRKTSRTEKKGKLNLKQRFLETVFWYEGYFGRRASASICVSKAMREDLNTAWQIPSAVFYDRPPDYKFRDVSLEEMHDLFMRLSAEEDYKAFQGETAAEDWVEWSAFTYCDINGQVKKRGDRPLLLISSTSWTPDEDFGILLDALVKFDRYSTSGTEIVRIVCAVTGKGEQKDEYIERIKRLQLTNVKIVTPWLEARDYPTLLAASDIGISLHTSTSGLDLPMKVVDMFGAKIPVLAKRYQCIGELVKEGENGQTFDNSHELCQQIQSLASGFPSNCKKLDELKLNVQNEPLPSWEETWKSVCETMMKPEINESLQRILARE